MAIKLGFDKQKSKETISEIMKSTVDLGKKAAASTKTNVQALVEKTKNDSYTRRLKKYNPIFPEQYNSIEFNIPNMIMIVDDAVRRDIDVCVGSIGWLNSDSGVEVLYLYDEAVKESGLQFLPTATCDAIYYVDSFDKNKFIRTDCIFSRAHEERIAELKNIAYCLGAKHCSFEIHESTKGSSVQKKDANISGFSSQENANQFFASQESTQRSGKVEIEFEGNNSPILPSLKWFANDDNIKRLIEMRCNQSNSIKSEVLELSGSSSAVMSQKTAYTIESAMAKMGTVKGHISMDSQAEKEHHSKLLYSVEF